MSTAPKPNKMSDNELRALAALKPHVQGALASSALTHFMAHGALQSFAEDSTLALKRSALEKAHPTLMSSLDVNSGVHGSLKRLQEAANYYFYKMEPTFQYAIPSPLMSYLTRPGKGKMYSEAYQPSDLPASITFMGQFIDRPDEERRQPRRSGSRPGRRRRLALHRPRQRLRPPVGRQHEGRRRRDVAENGRRSLRADQARCLQQRL
jgi:hypothetical protein